MRRSPHGADARYPGRPHDCALRSLDQYAFESRVTFRQVRAKIT
jgi:hypothetical protein